MQTCSVQVCSVQVCALRSLQSLHNAASVQCASVHYLWKCASVHYLVHYLSIPCGSVEVCIKVFSGQFYCYRESLCHSRDPPPTAPPALLLKILYSETLLHCAKCAIHKYKNTHIHKYKYKKANTILRQLPRRPFS